MVGYQGIGVTRFQPAALQQRQRRHQVSVFGRGKQPEFVGFGSILQNADNLGAAPTFHARDTSHRFGLLFQFLFGIREAKGYLDVILLGGEFGVDGGIHRGRDIHRHDETCPAHRQRSQRQEQASTLTKGVAQRERKGTVGKFSATGA